MPNIKKNGRTTNIYNSLTKLERYMAVLVMVVLSCYVYVQWSPNYSSNLGMNKFEKRILRRIIVGESENLANTTNRIIEVKRMARRTLTKSFYPITLVAPYKIENPDICSGVMVTVLFVVHTATDHFERRAVIRDTFGNKTIFKAIHTRTVFLLGTTNDTLLETKIRKENSMHSDLVQGDFVDTYSNLTHKAVMGLRWVTEHCNQAKMVVKIDDDMFIDVFKVVGYLPKFAKKKKRIVCHIWQRAPIERKQTKWQVDADSFRGVTYYPPYCSGFTVFTTPLVFKILYGLAFFTPFFWVDDVYVYGVLAMEQKIPRIMFDKYSLKWKVCEKSYKSPHPSKYVSCVIQHHKDMKMMWHHTVSRLSDKARRKVNDDILHVAKYGGNVLNETNREGLKLT